MGLFSIVILEVFTSPVQGKPGLPRMERPADDTLMIPAAKLRLPLEITIASALASEDTLTSADARFHRGPYPYGDRNLLAGPLRGAAKYLTALCRGPPRFPRYRRGTTTTGSEVA